VTLTANTLPPALFVPCRAGPGRRFAQPRGAEKRPSDSLRFGSFSSRFPARADFDNLQGERTPVKIVGEHGSDATITIRPSTAELADLSFVSILILVFELTRILAADQRCRRSGPAIVRSVIRGALRFFVPPRDVGAAAPS
jgi:hypothetical protein